LTLGRQSNYNFPMKLTKRQVEQILGYKIIKAWSTEELDYLRQNYGHKILKEIAEVLSRSVSGVRHMARQLGLVARARWTREQEQFLLEHQDWSRRKLAEAIGRTEHGVIKKLGRLRKQQQTG